MHIWVWSFFFCLSQHFTLMLASYLLAITLGTRYNYLRADAVQDTKDPKWYAEKHAEGLVCISCYCLSLVLICCVVCMAGSFKGCWKTVSCITWWFSQLIYSQFWYTLWVCLYRRLKFHDYSRDFVSVGPSRLAIHHCAVRIYRVVWGLKLTRQHTRIGYNLTTIMIERLVLNLQSHRTTSDSVDSSRSEDTTTDPAVLTSYIQFGYDEPTVESHPEPSSHQDTRRTKDSRSWFGNLSDRLADEQWGTAGVTEPDQSEKTRDCCDILEMQTMTKV